MSPRSAIPAFPESADIETSSEDYARRFEGEVGAWFLRVQEEGTLRLLNSQEGASVLDVGGGHGQVVGPLLARGHEVTVTGSASVCQERIKDALKDPQCTFELANVLDLPFPDQAFDVVLSYRLLSHVDRWEQFLGELARVARFAVIVDYPSKRSWNAISDQVFGLKRRLEGNTRPYTCYSPSELGRVFDVHGYRSDARFPEFFFPMVLHRMLGSARLSASLEGLCRKTGLTEWFGSPVIEKFVRVEEK